jgi:serine/threonine protein kinase
MSFEVGQTIGDYQILSVLGQGGMGAVYRVRSLLSHREEAMKVALPHAESDPQAAERFLREIRVQASLRHPNIAELRAAVRAGDHVLMILELIDGESVSAKLKNGPLPFDAAFRIADDILDALAYAHGRGVIHRDIKPSNILVTRGGVPKLTDFGVARTAGDDRITGTNVAVGSLHYMSPEQIRSSLVDERSDLYSLGVTLYELLTGRLPLQGLGAYDLMHAHITTTPTAPADVVPGLPVGISEAVMKSLAKSPAERFPSARAFQTALRHARFGEGATSTLASDPGSIRKSEVSEEPPTRRAIEPEEIQRIEKRLTSAIGPIARSLVAKAAQRHTSIAPLCHELADQIPNSTDRAAFLKAFGLGTAATPSKGSPAFGDSGSATEISAASLEAARQALAEYLGPMAGLIVNRAAKQARSIEELRDALAAEIPDERGRKAFLDRSKT